MENDNELASTLRNWFENAETQTQEPRDLSERDRDFYDGKQWTSEEVTEIEKRGQSPIVINRIKRKIDALKGIEQKQRTDPKAFPRNPQDEDAAQAATEALRFIVENNSYDQIRSAYWENLCVEGIGAVKVSIKEGRNGIEVVVKRVPWDRFFYDPHSSEVDFSDAKYVGEVIWMYFEDAKRKWPDSVDIFQTMEDSINTETYGDKPKVDLWVNAKDKRVRIIQTRWKDGDEWRITTSTKGGVIKDGVSPFIDEDGKPESDLLAVSAFVDRDNNRYGSVREMIGPQEEINKRRSKALHLMSVRQVRVEPAIEGDIETIRTELSKPDGVVEAKVGDIEILPTGDMASAQFNLLQEAKNEIDAMGANSSLQGKGQRDLSGRAMLAQQQAGLVELAPLLDRKRDLDIRVYRAMWNRVKQFWTEERWIRITDNPEKPKFIGLNQPATIGAQLEKEFGQVPPEMAQMQELSLPANENGQQIIHNNVAEMDLDIVLDEGPDMITLQAEQFEQLTQMSSMVQFPPEVYIEASNLHNKKALLEILSGGEQDPAELQRQQELQMRMQDLQMRGEEAKVMKTEAEAQDELASIEERQSKVVLNLSNAQNSANGVANQR